MNLKDLYKPNREFKERTRNRYLSAFREKFPETGVSRAPFKYYLRGLATGIVFMVLIGAASTYADQKNVGPNNVLYPLKRAQESIKLILAEEENKPAIHLELAERRLEEIKAVRERDPESPQIEKLTQDLRKEISGSLETFRVIRVEPAGVSAPAPALAPLKPDDGIMAIPQGADGREPSLPEESVEVFSPTKSAPVVSVLPSSILKKEDFSVCETWREIIEFEESSLGQIIEDKPKLLEQFNQKCQVLYRIFPPPSKTNQ